MTSYIARRLLGVIPVLFGVSLLTFLVLRLIPGDPALLILGERATPAQWEALRSQMGLDRPLFVDLTGQHPVFDSQYTAYMRDLLTGFDRFWFGVEAGLYAPREMIAEKFTLERQAMAYLSLVDLYGAG